LPGEHRVPLKTLLRRWEWLTLLAIGAFAVLYFLDVGLKSATGYGTVDLQSAQTAADFKRIVFAWIVQAHTATAAFSLGFDYLFMPLYGFAFFYSGIIVREAFFPKKGWPRRIMNYLALVPLAGALADAAENALEFSMLVSGASDRVAELAYRATNAKTICFTVGLVLLAAALAGFFKLRAPKKEEPA
jgi:hypothetical protein